MSYAPELTFPAKEVPSLFSREHRLLAPQMIKIIIPNHKIIVYNRPPLQTNRLKMTQLALLPWR